LLGQQLPQPVGLVILLPVCRAGADHSHPGGQAAC
jgi:CHASE1-domain containing sensor protein